MKNKIQHSFNNFDHDSLQFHFFCDKLIGACRIFYTNSLCHSSIWIYNNNEMKEIFSSSNPINSSNSKILDINVDNLTIKEIENKIFKIELINPGISISLQSVNLESWNDTRSKVIHLPNMKAEIKYKNKTYSGTGYSKRYSWKPSPIHWGYRFIQGFNKNDQSSIWTADATFGLNKYDYFKILKPDGELINTFDDISFHRQNYMRAKTTHGNFKIELEEIGLWKVNLKSSKMDSLLQQRLCKFQAKLKNKKMFGFAINETCYGTLG